MGNISTPPSLDLTCVITLGMGLLFLRCVVIQNWTRLEMFSQIEDASDTERISERILPEIVSTYPK